MSPSSQTPSSPLPQEPRKALAQQLGNAQPATDDMIASLATSVANVKNHEHPTWEDLYCYNLTSYMGERMATVLRRLLNAETELTRLRVERAELIQQRDRIANDVMAALPSRAEVLREALAALRQDVDHIRYGSATEYAERHAALLARMAAEADDAAPRTERSYWSAIAAALNAAEAMSMPVGIDLDGTLTDHRAWSVVRDRAAERWAVAGYDGELADTAEASASTVDADGDTTAPATRQCGYDDYHDPHEWADRPGAWCPGHGYDDAAVGEQR